MFLLFVESPETKPLSACAPPQGYLSGVRLPRHKLEKDRVIERSNFTQICAAQLASEWWVCVEESRDLKKKNTQHQSTSNSQPVSHQC